MVLLRLHNFGRKNIWSFVIIFTSFLTKCTGAPQLTEIDWTTKIKLDNGYEAKWITSDEDWFTMEIKAPTTGWVAVGFTKNGAMKGADIIMGWIDTNGNAFLKDLHGVGNQIPVEDSLQNVELLGGESNDGSTTIRFRRGWRTCDNDDYSIGEETVKLIWAFGKIDPTSEIEFNPPYHERHQRGIKMVNLKLPSKHTQFPEDMSPPDTSIKYFDILMNNYPVPGKEVTEYFCLLSKYPEFDTKSQIVGFRPMIQKENIPVVHHLVIYECVVPEGNSKDIFEKHVGRVEPCYSPSMPPEWANFCWTQTIVWTIGGEGDMFPSHTGMPLGEKHGGSTYFFVEMHYDIPEKVPFTDNSGLRIYYTDKPREQDLSTIFIGKRFSTFHFIAPGAVGYKVFGGCTSECTEKAIPPEGITVTHALMHAHQVTKMISIRHIRNGVELPPFATDTNYDINYQQAHIVDPPRKILPGDELYTYCEYDTTQRKVPLWGGITTNDTEMCHTFLTYYPKIPLATCQWQTEYDDFLNTFDIQGLEGDILPIVSTPYKPMLGEKYDPPDEVFVLLAENKSTNLFTQLKISDSGENHGKYLWDYLTKLDWKKDGGKLAKSVNKKLEKAKNYAYCTEHAHVKIPLENYIMEPPVFKKYKDPLAQKCNKYLKPNGSGKEKNIEIKQSQPKLFESVLKYVTSIFNPKQSSS